MNSRFTAIKGHTDEQSSMSTRYEARTPTGRAARRTFFEARVSAQPDLLPHVAHRFGPSDVGPVVEEEAHLDLATRAHTRQRASASAREKRQQGRRTLRTSSNAAEKSEKTSYATLSTVSDLMMCWNARSLSSCRSSSERQQQGQHYYQCYRARETRTVSKAIDSLRGARARSSGVVLLPFCDPGLAGSRLVRSVGFCGDRRLVSVSELEVTLRLGRCRRWRGGTK